ncbi:Mitochondrial inner membrane protein Mpv17 [Caenorhabditis elegans]|uniref:Mitochondrial inner membrane protein Mpv17 n=1 Tax=Caenorhabditis elegans TaxID=6239 RepID=MPV17_CAEEL|nr:Mpv17-like protein [Caenorhabditis elegans]Q7YWV6.1 RecName: Full=Mpv17-like protein [Caenorhabditis elegans]CAE17916.1 Mpv17-like protein [Caenorhabditis elegans]|eukprot:NP_001024916.1 Mpv17-like protein [Caenorhabditis elegans]
MVIILFIRRRLATNPLSTQMCIAGTISGSGDCLAQYLSHNQEWDRWRTARFSFLSSCFMAPSLFIWFRLLEKVKGNNKSLLLVKKLCIDQLCFSPCFNAAILFNLRLLQHQSAEKSWDLLKEDWFNIYATSLKVWPFVQVVNLCFVPLNYRVILNQVVAFFWNCYLSYITQKPIDHIEQFY